MSPARIAAFLLKGATLAAGLLVAALLAITLTWAWRGGAQGGLAAMARLLRHGTTTVDDFRHYPGRALAASAVPAPFATAATAAAPPPEAELEPGRRTSLATALKATETLAFLVVRDDAIVYERYGEGSDAAAPSQFFSVTKSILATLAAMAVDDGILRSLDQPVTDFVPELKARGFDRVTLRHLLDMRSGLSYTENDNPFGLHVLMNYTADLERLILSFRMQGEPGGRWDYKSGDTALLSLALRRALGATTLTQYAQRRLWTPLGMEHGGTWSLDREGGLEKAWCCLAGTARDLARIGRLYLARGAPSGRRLLAQRWVDDAFAPMPDAGPLRAHRFSWWSARPQGQGIMAIGKDGQFLYIDPASRTIVVRLGRSQGEFGSGRWAALFAALAAHPW